jgi:hypothetical protein
VERVEARSEAPEALRSPIRTLQPSWEKRVEIALPKPEAPPVIWCVSYMFDVGLMELLTCYDGNFALESGACHLGILNRVLWIELG